MGYLTDYYGTIYLSKEGADKLKKHYKESEDLEEEFNFEGITFNLLNDKPEIEISGYSKLDDEQLKKFCFFIAILDKKSSGFINCYGEDKEDIWGIKIKDGKAEIQ